MPNLEQEYKALFIAPYATRAWASVQGRMHWVNLEGWQDAMAGPISAIVDNGECGYVYARDDGYFASVEDPASLRERLLHWHSGLSKGVEQFESTTPDTAKDFAYIRSVVDRIRVLIERVCVIEQHRWQLNL